MKTRAVFPFDASGISTGSITVSGPPDPSTRKAGTTYSLPVGVVLRAPVSCIATFDPTAGGSPGQLRLAPAMPLDLTAGLTGWRTIGVAAIVFEGLDPNFIAGTVTCRADGTARKTIASPTGGTGPSNVDAVPADWAAGSQSVYLEGGAKILDVLTPVDVELSVLVAQGTVEVFLDGGALLAALDADDHGFAADGTPPAGFPFGVVATPLLGVGPQPAGSAQSIETVVCSATGVEVFGPPDAPEGLPADLAYLSPGTGTVTLALDSGTGDWSAAIQNETPASLGSAIGAPQFEVQLPSGWWGSRPDSALTCEVTVVLTGGSVQVDLPVLEPPPVADSGRASRADVPTSSGSPRLSILVSDLPTGSAITNFGSSGATPTVTVSNAVGSASATDVTVSPDGKRLFFTAPPLSAGQAELVIGVGSDSATLPAGVSYTDDVVAGLDNLKASLAVMAEEAVLVAETAGGGGDVVETFCATMRTHVTSFQTAVMIVGAKINSTDAAQTDAWSEMMINQASLIRDTVNEAATALDVPPFAMLYGPDSGTDDEPDYNPDAFVLAVTLLNQVIVST